MDALIAELIKYGPIGLVLAIFLFMMKPELKKLIQPDQSNSDVKKVLEKLTHTEKSVDQIKSELRSMSEDVADNKVKLATIEGFLEGSGIRK